MQFVVTSGQLQFVVDAADERNARICAGNVLGRMTLLPPGYAPQFEMEPIAEPQENEDKVVEFEQKDDGAIDVAS